LACARAPTCSMLRRHRSVCSLMRSWMGIASSHPTSFIVAGSSLCVKWRQSSALVYDLSTEDGHVRDLASEVDEAVEHRGLAIRPDARGGPARDALHVQHPTTPALRFGLRSTPPPPISRSS
jgi:hypothetical protein